MAKKAKKNKKTNKEKCSNSIGLIISFGLGIITLFFSLSNLSLAKETNATEHLQPASAKSIIYAMNEPVTVQNWLAVGTKRNKGKLYVKGYLQNPNKNKPLRVKDNMVVDGNLTVSGKLLGTGIIGTQNLGEGVVTAEKLGNSAVTGEKIYDGVITAAKLADSSVTSAKIQNDTIVAEDLASNSVTSAKIVDRTILGSDIANSTVAADNIDFSPGNGFVLAAAYVLGDGTVSRYFNNLSPGTDITAEKMTIGIFSVNFGADISERYFVVTPYYNENPVYAVIDSLPSFGGKSITIRFYNNSGSVNPAGFFIVAY